MKDIRISHMSQFSTFPAGERRALLSLWHHWTSAWDLLIPSTVLASPKSNFSLATQYFASMLVHALSAPERSDNQYASE